MNEQQFRREYLGEFIPMGHTMEMELLDKKEVIDLTNMMFRFSLRTGSKFKIEEYAESVFILTDVARLRSSDVDYFYKKNQQLARKIWFTQLSPNKKLVNLYEDCPINRRVYYPPYNKSCNFMNILHRTQSISFILED